MVSFSLVILDFLFGLLSAFSPCLFPLLPSFVALTLKANLSRFKIFLSSLAIILGVLVVFLLLGMVSTLVGSFLIRNYYIFARIQGGVLILAGLIMIKPPDFIYRVSLPDKLNKWLFAEDRKENPFVFSFVLGLLFTIIAAPCAAGYFLAVWGTLLNEAFIFQFALVLAFSVGAGLPFMVISVFLPDVRSDYVGKIRAASSHIGIILGIILILVGLVLILGVSPSFTGFV